MLIAAVPTLRLPERPADAARAPVVLRAGLVQDLPLDKGWFGKARRCMRRKDVQLRDPPRPDAGHRRRIGLGQEHGGALRRAPDRPQRRRGAAG
jgi:hypothetical protein